MGGEVAEVSGNDGRGSREIRVKLSIDKWGKVGKIDKGKF